MENATCVLSSLLLGVNEWVQGNGSRAVLLPLTRHQSSVYFLNSRVAHSATKRNLAPQTTRATLDRLTKRECKEIYLIMAFSTRAVFFISPYDVSEKCLFFDHCVGLRSVERLVEVDLLQQLFMQLRIAYPDKGERKLSKSCLQWGGTYA